MRLSILAFVAAASAGLALVAGGRPALAQQPSGGEDLLGELVIEAGQKTRPLPKIGIMPSLSSNIEDVTLRSVMRRDLELCGEFDVLPESAAPEGLYLSDTPVDVAAWASKGAEAVVKVSGRRISRAEIELVASVYLKNGKAGAPPAFERKLKVPDAVVREGSHRAADLVIGALTGTNGGFASRMTFVLGKGTSRRVFTIDADGHDATAVSPAGMTALSPVFGPGGELFYAAGTRGEPYGVYSVKRGRIPLSGRGAVYGLAFAPDGSKVALSVGAGANVQVLAGPDFDHLSPAASIPMALHPEFSPRGDLVFAGEGRYGQRIYLNGRPISPEGVFASSPVMCDHPTGVKALFSIVSGPSTHIVATGERGGPFARLTSGPGTNSDPACSPDGRLVAFFSTRTTGEGPGLYVMRLTGGRPKRISPLVGDSLRWGPLSRMTGLAQIGER
ncbi:MAG: tolB protein [Polyangiaceae bacterium]|nr:tolB protein [Polyangiaceae bacterium]